MSHAPEINLHSIVAGIAVGAVTRRQLADVFGVAEDDTALIAPIHALIVLGIVDVAPNDSRTLRLTRATS